MTPETSAYLAKAQEDLRQAKAMLEIELAAPAARSGYFAIFHAAEALVFERSGKIAKTHSGVHSEFARLTRGRTDLGEMPHAFLTHAYHFKQDADYGVDATVVVSLTDAREVIERAHRLVDAIDTAIRADTP